MTPLKAFLLLLLLGFGTVAILRFAAERYVRWIESKGHDGL